MFNTDYAYSEHTKEYSKMLAPAFLKHLFCHTAKDGSLIIPDHPYRMLNEEPDTKWLRCTMNWTDRDMVQVSKDVRKLWAILLGISDEHPRLGKTTEENADILDESQLKVWDLYLRDLDDGRFERDIQRSIHRLSVDCKRIEAQMNPDGKHHLRRGAVVEKLDYRDERVFVRWRRSPEIQKAIEERFDTGLFDFDLCIRIKRLYYLMVLEEIAPNDAYYREQKRVAQYLALNRFCSDAVRYSTSPI